MPPTIRQATKPMIPPPTATITRSAPEGLSSVEYGGRDMFLPNVQDEPRPLEAVGSGAWLGFFFIRRPRNPSHPRDRETPEPPHRASIRHALPRRGSAA